LKKSLERKAKKATGFGDKKKRKEKKKTNFSKYVEGKLSKLKMRIMGAMIIKNFLLFSKVSTSLETGNQGALSQGKRHLRVKKQLGTKVAFTPSRGGGVSTIYKHCQHHQIAGTLPYKNIF